MGWKMPLWPPPKIAASPGGMRAPYMVPWANPSPLSKRHLDLFCRFSTTHGRVQQRDTRTDHATSVATGLVSALRASYSAYCTYIFIRRLIIDREICVS